MHFIVQDKEQHLFEIEIFCGIINVFIVTFEQFNAFLLSKSIYICHEIKILLTLNFQTVLNISLEEACGCFLNTFVETNFTTKCSRRDWNTNGRYGLSSAEWTPPLCLFWAARRLW